MSEILSSVAEWTELEKIVRSEVSQGRRWVWPFLPRVWKSGWAMWETWTVEAGERQGGQICPGRCTLGTCIQALQYHSESHYLVQLIHVNKNKRTAIKHLLLDKMDIHLCLGVEVKMITLVQWPLYPSKEEGLAYSILFLFSFETGSLYLALAVLEFTT